MKLIIANCPDFSPVKIVDEKSRIREFRFIAEFGRKRIYG